MSVSSMDWPASELLYLHARARASGLHTLGVHAAGGLVLLIGLVVAPWPDVSLPDLLMPLLLIGGQAIRAVRRPVPCPPMYRVILPESEAAFSSPCSRRGLRSALRHLAPSISRSRHTASRTPSRLRSGFSCSSSCCWHCAFCHRSVTTAAMPLRLRHKAQLGGSTRRLRLSRGTFHGKSDISSKARSPIRRGARFRQVAAERRGWRH